MCLCNGRSLQCQRFLTVRCKAVTLPITSEQKSLSLTFAVSPEQNKLRVCLFVVLLTSRDPVIDYFTRTEQYGVVYSTHYFDFLVKGFHRKLFIQDLLRHQICTACSPAPKSLLCRSDKTLKIKHGKSNS